MSPEEAAPGIERCITRGLVIETTNFSDRSAMPNILSAARAAD
jgi:hypothetical protein